MKSKKPRKCVKCGKITDLYTKFKLVWSNGAYKFLHTPTKIDKFIICFDCTEKLERWLSVGIGK